MNRDHSVIFEIASTYCISDSFVDHDGYSISSEEFLPTVVDIMVNWVKIHPLQSILVCWFLECWHSPLPSLAWPLPTCLHSWTWYSRFLAILLFTASDLASITSHIHSWVLFLLWVHPFILSRVISPLILLTWGVHLLVSYLFAFSCCSWGSQGKNNEVICHSLLQWITFCQTFPPRPAHLGWPKNGMAQFHWVR